MSEICVQSHTANYYSLVQMCETCKEGHKQCGNCVLLVCSPSITPQQTSGKKELSHLRSVSLHERVREHAGVISAQHQPQNIGQCHTSLAELCTFAETPLPEAHQEIQHSSDAVPTVKP